MKALNVKRRGVIVATVAVAFVAIVGGSVAATTILSQKTPTKQNTEVVAKRDAIKVEEAPEVANAETTQEEQVAPVAPVPLDSPVIPSVLSTQQYAEKYLNLGLVLKSVTTDITGQGCFDALVAAFPGRFAEDVREKNVKALSVYTSPCGTGYGSSEAVKRSWDAMYPNGSFFDSEMAKSKW